MTLKRYPDGVAGPQFYDKQCGGAAVGPDRLAAAVGQPRQPRDAPAALDRPRLDTPVGLDSLAKATGAKGLQVFVPLNTPVTFEQTKAFSRNVAEVMEARIGDRVVARADKRLRAGKVLVNWGQNDRHRSTVAAYALGAKLARPTVSHPSSASRSGFRAERHRHETDVTRAWREARLRTVVAAERALLGRRQGSSGCAGSRGRSGGAA